MPTYTPVIDNGGQVYNARAYGATGDGSTNDAPYINGALTAARKTGEYGTPGGQGQPVLVPSGIHRLASSGSTPGALNLTGSQFNLLGAGSHQTVLRGDTGGVVIDMAATGLSTVRSLLIDNLGMTTNASTIGILQARHSSGAQAHSNHLHNVSVRLGANAAANGGNGTVGLYNVGCETTTYENVQLRADIPLFMSAGNNLSAGTANAAYAASSPYVGTLAANTSMTVVGLRGTSVLQALGGPAVRIAGAAEIDLGDSVLASVWNEAGLTAGYPYAMESVSQTHALYFSGAVYGFPRVLRVRSALAGLFLECYAAHGAGQARIYLEAGATIEGGRIDVVPLVGTSGGTLIEAQQGYQSIVHGLEINLYQQGIDLKANGILSGCLIRSSRSLAATKAGIVAAEKRGNVIVATDGVHVDGLTPW